MKKYLALILALALMLTAFCGCGKSEAPEKAETTPAEATTESTEDDASAQAAIEATSDYVTQEVIETFVGDVSVYRTNDEQPYAGEHDKDTLYYGQTINIQALDPAKIGDSSALFMVYDTLLTADPDTGELVGKLATDWEWLDDTTLHMTIRDDVYFSNGEQLTAEDCLYSLIRLADPEKSTQKQGCFANIDVENSYVEDDFNFVVKLTQIQATFLSNLTLGQAGILCKSHVEQAGEDSFWDSPVGSGPYVQSAVVSGDRYEFTRNENYWGELPAIKNVVMRYYAETTTMFIDYENGALDLIASAASTDAERVLNGEVANTVMGIYPELRIYSLLMYYDEGYLADPLVRQAISYAIDVDTMVDVAYGILAKPADSLLANGVNYRVETPHVYDPDMARQLLAEAGYEEGEITIEIGTNTFAALISMAEVMQSMLAEVGINLEIGTYDMMTHIQRMMGVNNGGIPEMDMGFGVTAITNLDPDMLFSTLLSTATTRMGSIQDEHINELIINGSSSLDTAVREQNYTELQNILVDEAWSIPTAETLCAVVYRDYVSGVQCIDPRSPIIADISFEY